MDETKKLAVRVSKAAALLDMPRSSAYEAIHKGELPAIIINGRLRVPMVAIEKMIEERLQRGIDNE